MIAVSKTNTGLVRTANEDALLTDGPELFAIADGMGGYAGGEIASVETIKVLKEEKKNFAGLTGEALCTALKEAASKANSHLRSLVCKCLITKAWAQLWLRCIWQKTKRPML